MEIKVSGSVFVSLELLYRSIGVGWGYFFFLFWGGYSFVYVFYNGILGVFF